ncbi:MAG: hypothetical protein ABIQ44_04285, partial [Chloroflexia bacterium]
VWAVGGYYGPAGGSAAILFEHWNGSEWNIVPAPVITDSMNTYMEGVTAIASNDVWAVGWYEVGAENKSLTLHWNGVQWLVVSSPSLGYASYLFDVDYASTNDVWALGYYSQARIDFTFVLHWDGTQWSQVMSPNPGFNEGDAHLRSMDIIAANDIWAVGDIVRPQGIADETLALHWNGTAWSIVTTPGMPNEDNYLSAVSGVSSSDVWAVGYYTSGAVDHNLTLTMHWNGSAWSIAASPNPEPDFVNRLEVVLALAPNNVWAMGYSKYSTYVNDPRNFLIMHWDGTQWSLSAPPSGTDDYYKYALGASALSPTDAWLVGVNSQHGRSQTLTAHYNGVEWSLKGSPNRGTPNNFLYGIDGVSATDVWAVGEANGPLIEHWNGTQWSAVPVPESERGQNNLQSVSVRASNDVWAVGSSYTRPFDQPLTLHWDGSAWSVVPVNLSSAVGSAYLTGVSALSANSVWAVGYYYTPNTSGPYSLTLYWNGTQWSQVESPPNSYLQSVAAISFNNVWAVGHDFSAGQPQPSVLHWNGNNWASVTVPAPGGAGKPHYLYGVAASSA